MHLIAKYIFVSSIATFLLAFGVAYAQDAELSLNTETVAKAEVIDILEVEERIIPGTETKTTYQTIRVKILEGEEAGKIVTVENDYMNLNKGDVFYLTHVQNDLDGTDIYTVGEPYRLTWLYIFAALFLIAVVVFGGIQGIRGLVSLAISLLFIYFLLFPAILAGYSPILISLGVASLIIILGSYITHGFNRTTSTAVLGMLITIVITGVLAYLGVEKALLTGFDSEEAVYLNFGTRGAIDFASLLLGGILIGLLGVLYDAAISQSIAVEELSRIGPNLSRGFIMRRALRMGKEHIGALVNTLAIAYVGASLPLLLLFYYSATSFTMTLNREIFAAEVIRTMVGSIGLVLAVPITTFIATLMLVKNESDNKISGEKILEEEKKVIEYAHHKH